MQLAPCSGGVVVSYLAFGLKVGGVVLEMNLAVRFGAHTGTKITRTRTECGSKNSEVTSSTY